MEKIQERALKCVYSNNTASNEYLLNKARLPSLEAGRQMNIAIQTFKILNDLGTYHLISGGGGGARVFVACKLFFYLRWKTSFFLAINVRQFIFLCFVEEFFCHMLSLLCSYHLVFFLHIFFNIFFINFDNKLFLSAHIFNKLFFSDFCGDKLFFSILI